VHFKKARLYCTVVGTIIHIFPTTDTMYDNNVLCHATNNPKDKRCVWKIYVYLCGPGIIWFTMIVASSSSGPLWWAGLTQIDTVCRGGNFLASACTKLWQALKQHCPKVQLALSPRRTSALRRGSRQWSEWCWRSCWKLDVVTTTGSVTTNKNYISDI
jgi:hypothetical protein